MIDKSQMTHDITLIAAVAGNGVIGGNNTLLWNFPNDMKRFVRLTTGKTIVMGRKTFESIGMALPNRHNIVVSHNQNYQAEGADVATIEHVLMLSCFKPVMVIGGSQIYNEFLPYARKMEITQILAPFRGDTYFPEVCEMQWNQIHNERFRADEKHRFPYDFDTYERIYA